MVNRFFLVPESKYNMLLSQDHALFESKKDADNVLKNRKLTPGEKNALYNQKLANVLKTREEALKRPIKVKLESSSTRAPSASTSGIAAKPPPTKRHRKRTASPKTGFESSAEEESDAFGEDFQGGSYETPRGFPKTQIPEDAKAIIESIKQEVLKNKNKFLVHDDGRIIGNDRKIIKNSNAGRSIEHLFEAPLGNTPPGFKKLRTRLLKEESTRKLIDQFEANVERLNNFKADEWNY